MTTTKIIDFAGSMELMDERIKRIEESLNLVLSRLSLPQMPELGSAVVSHELSIPSLPPATAASHQTVATPRRTSEIKEGPYIYKPLDASKSEIRILTILNDTTDDDPIRCTLTHVSLDDKKNHGKNLSQDITRMLTWYTAMSYTWGTLSRSHTILLDGHIFPVTANLEAALRNWSRDKAMQDWWIDAICINQEDMLERNSQVALMTRIYAQCRSVEIWLGEEADDSKLAMQVIQKLSDGDPVRGPGEKKVVLQEISKKQRVRHWRALTALFQRPWWQRVWIRQEVAIPRIATVHCGDESCPLVDVISAAVVLDDIQNKIGFLPIPPQTMQISGHDAVVRVSCYRQAIDLASHNVYTTTGTEFQDLRQMIATTRMCQATDPRDKVFGVLGMADPDVYGLYPDYRLDVREIYIKAAKTLITAKQDLSVLSIAQNPDRKHGLPSWVPNLLDDWKANPFSQDSYTQLHPYDEVEYSFQNINSIKDAGIDTDGDGDDKDLILKVRGRTLGSIALLCPTTVSPDDDSSTVLDGVYHAWKAFAASTRSRAAVKHFAAHALVNSSRKINPTDDSWLSFLSISTDNSGLRLGADGKPLVERVETEELFKGNHRVVGNLLIPGEKDGERERQRQGQSPYAKLHRYMRVYGPGRRLVAADSGFVCLVPEETRVGDVLVRINGARYVYVLRSVGREGFVVVGEAYTDPWPNPEEYTERWYALL